MALGRVAALCPEVSGDIIQQMSSDSLSGNAKVESPSSDKDLKGCMKSHSETNRGLCLLSLVARVPPSVSVVVLGVGRVAAVRRGVGALILASLAPSPP